MGILPCVLVGNARHDSRAVGPIGSASVTLLRAFVSRNQLSVVTRERHRALGLGRASRGARRAGSPTGGRGGGAGGRLADPRATLTGMDARHGPCSRPRDAARWSRPTTRAVRGRRRSASSCRARATASSSTRRSTRNRRAGPRPRISPASATSAPGRRSPCSSTTGTRTGRSSPGLVLHGTASLLLPGDPATGPERARAIAALRERYPQYAGPRPRGATDDPDRCRDRARLGRGQPQRRRKRAEPVGRRQWVDAIAWW